MKSIEINKYRALINGGDSNHLHINFDDFQELEPEFAFPAGVSDILLRLDDDGNMMTAAIIDEKGNQRGDDSYNWEKLKSFVEKRAQYRSQLDAKEQERQTEREAAREKAEEERKAKIKEEKEKREKAAKDAYDALPQSQKVAAGVMANIHIGDALSILIDQISFLEGNKTTEFNLLKQRLDAIKQAVNDASSTGNDRRG